MIRRYWSFLSILEEYDVRSHRGCASAAITVRCQRPEVDWNVNTILKLRWRRPTVLTASKVVSHWICIGFCTMWIYLSLRTVCILQGILTLPLLADLQVFVAANL
jgi:hypothetical protein